MRLAASLFALLFVLWHPLSAAGAASPPRVAVSPLIPPGPDDGLELGRTFADLLGAQLSGSDRWQLVERAQLPLIEDEWLVKGSGLALRSASLRLGALARADLVLECRISPAGDEHPVCTVAVIETARAETLAQSVVPLAARPTGPWYRSPPEADAQAIAAAARENLARAALRLDEWRGRPVAALLFAIGEKADAPDTLAALRQLAATVETDGARWTSLRGGAVSESEGLLQLQGLSSADLSPWAAAADVFVWAETRDNSLELAAWSPDSEPAQTRLALPATPENLAAFWREARARSRSETKVDLDAGRRALARSFLESARRLAQPLGLPENVRSLELERWTAPAPEKQAALRQLRALLDAAAFFALDDPEIQELRLAAAARLATGADKTLLLQSYGLMADRFWVRPDGSLDSRLCIESFDTRFLPFGFQKRRIPAVLARLQDRADRDLAVFAPLLEKWTRRLCDGPGQDESDLALLEKLWPLVVRALGDRIYIRAGDKIDLHTALRMTPPAWHARVSALLATEDARSRLKVADTGPTLAIRPSPRPRLVPATTVPATAAAQPPRPLPDASPAGPQTPPPAALRAPRPDEPLLAAAFDKNWTEVDRLLSARPDLSAKAGSTENNRPVTVGQFLLRDAIAARQTALARKLLAAGVKPSDSKYQPHLSLLLARAGRLDADEVLLARELVAAGARIPERASPYLALVSRCQSHLANTRPGQSVSTATTRFVLEPALRAFAQLREIGPREIDDTPCIDSQDEEGRTALIMAMQSGWAEGVRALVDSGANLDAGRYQGRNARWLIAEKPEIARLLENRAAPADTPSPSSAASPPASTPAPAANDGPEVVAALRRGDSALLSRTSLNPSLLAYRDPKGWSVLHHALDRKAADFAARLVAAGAPLDVLTNSGQSPLAFAAAMRLEKLVELMLAAGAPVDLRHGDAPTALYQAAYSQTPSLVRRLLAAGADIRARVGDDHSAVIHAAAERPDNVPVLETLVAAGADPKALSDRGSTALDRALASGAYQNIEYLHRLGVGWRERAPGESAPLVYAAENGYAEMVRALLAIGLWDERALPAARSPAVKALLEDAAAKRGSKVVDNLALWPAICADRENWRRRAEAHLAAGGDVNFILPDGTGQTPLELALRSMNPAFVRFLLDRGAVPRTRRTDGGYVTHPPTLCAVRLPLWLADPGVSRPDTTVDSATTVAQWDAYAADMIALIAPRWPDPLYARLLKDCEQLRMPKAAAALRAAGVEPN